MLNDCASSGMVSDSLKFSFDLRGDGLEVDWRGSVVFVLIGQPFSFFGACAVCGGRRGLIGDSAAVTRYISCAEGVKRVGEGSDDVRRGFGLGGGGLSYECSLSSSHRFEYL